jgi:septal ring factor EnvC (AmiA/AmiB activator)
VSNLRTEVFLAIGEASMCWTETPHGIFDRQRAEEMAHDLDAKIEQLEGEAARYKAKFTNQVDYAISLEHTIRDIETDLATIRNYETSSLGKANKLVQKLQQANQVLRDGLGYYANNCAMDDFQSDCCGDSARQALEQADKIMEGI